MKRKCKKFKSIEEFHRMLTPVLLEDIRPIQYGREGRVKRRVPSSRNQEMIF